MKLIRNEDLSLALKLLNPPNMYLSNNDVTLLLEVYGDDWFVEDGRWKLTTENQKMKELREKYVNDQR